VGPIAVLDALVKRKIPVEAFSVREFLFLCSFAFETDLYRSWPHIVFTAIVK
jgi:hypothetical protein